MKTQDEIEKRLITLEQEEEKVKQGILNIVHHDAESALENYAKFLHEIRIKIDTLEWVLSKRQ
jgi:hypothetical protein